MCYIFVSDRELNAFVIEVSIYIVVNFLVGIHFSADLNDNIAPIIATPTQNIWYSNDYVSTLRVVHALFYELNS